MKQYWEIEQPLIYSSEKNVVKVYVEQGRIQVFPTVPKSKHGIGRGATLDLTSLSNETLIDLIIKNKPNILNSTCWALFINCLK